MYEHAVVRKEEPEQKNGMSYYLQSDMCQFYILETGSVFSKYCGMVFGCVNLLIIKENT